MSIYTKEKVKLSLLLIALILTILITFNIIFTSIERSLKQISASQDRIITILEQK